MEEKRSEERSKLYLDDLQYRLGDFAKAFSQVDLIAGPTCPSPAFKFGEKSSDPLTMYLEDIFTIAANLAGVCGISLPCGWTAPHADRPALPIGLQLLGPSLGEAKLLRAARACEQAVAFPAQPR